jgi:hypothetical protein
MKILRLLPFSLIVVFLLPACTKSDDQVLHRAELILPGLWNIESVTLPANPMGVKYQGSTFYTDTTLLNVGSLFINSFSLDKKELHSTDIDCELTIDNQPVHLSMDAVFTSGDELWATFESGAPEGVYSIVTPAEGFYWSAQILNSNYIVDIIDGDNIRLLRANDQENHIILLSKP